jgi:hypothetical protein
MSRRLLIALTLLLFAVAAAACGGGEALTLDEYFERLDAVEQKAEDDSNVATEQLDAARNSDSEQELVQGTTTAFETFARSLDEYVKGLEAIKAPDDVRAEHKEAVDATEAYAAIVDDLIDALGRAETSAEVDQALQSTVEGAAFIAADQRFTDSCVALQTAADENDIDVDLNCGEA